MDVVFLSPDYPTDLPLFVSGLAEVGHASSASAISTSMRSPSGPGVRWPTT